MKGKSALALSLASCLGCVMEKRHEHLDVAGRTDSLPFSHAVRTGDTLYIAGTLGLDPKTGQPPPDVEQEVRLMLDDMKKKLALAGMTMDDLVSVQVFCPDLTLYETFNRIYATYFEGEFPARSFIGSGPLLRGARFEVNGVAVNR
jgi:2-iminobutanoate/2-iminopropanoate deaminase